jgi:methylated-DNA-[protein]-cysteine S-methyltransferase
MLLNYDQLESPIGSILLAVEGGQLCALEFADSETRFAASLRRRYGSVSLHAAADPCEFSSRLRAYFAGELHTIDGIAVCTGGTSFQQQVWAALRAIPPGTTRSYGALAAQLGNPAAARAVGAANGRNPISIVIPCHRLIGSDGRLVKYGGGMDRKGWLLRHEGAMR